MGEREGRVEGGEKKVEDLEGSLLGLRGEV